MLTIITRTERFSSEDSGGGVTYQVIAPKNYSPDPSERTFVNDDGELVVWQTHVYFGHDEAHCAGGKAFVEAAREQQHQATQLRHRVVAQLGKEG